MASLIKGLQDCFTLAEPVSTSTTMASTPSVVDPDVGPGSYKGNSKYILL